MPRDPRIPPDAEQFGNTQVGDVPWTHHRVRRGYVETTYHQPHYPEPPPKPDHAQLIAEIVDQFDDLRPNCSCECDDQDAWATLRLFVERMVEVAPSKAEDWLMGHKS